MTGADRSFPLGAFFAHLCDDGRCLPLPVSDTFWSETIETLPAGRLISVLDSHADWSSWEMHPAGDEFIQQISGVMTLVFEAGSGLSPIRLEPGHFAIVPTGAWHTADIEQPGSALFITAGEGTQSRPR